MKLSHSWWRKAAVTVVVAVTFVLLYQVQTIDSRYAARHALYRETASLPAPGARLRFTATAYCKGQITASGVKVRTGVAAADPALLPVGSVIQVGADAKYTGVYTIMDTGPAVQGRQIDIYMWSCHEALRFGRRAVDVTVLRLGWDPSASHPTMKDTLLNRPRPERPRALEAKPLPLGAPDVPKDEQRP
jgi:3D (Asp-Asp-Asp) domain-containing protein